MKQGLTASSPIRVLVAEDDDQLRAAICDLIAGEPGLEVVAGAGSAESAIGQAGKVKPDVALLDVRMPGGGPLAAKEIRRVSPGTHSVALSAYHDRSSVLAMLRAGSIGYLVKGDSLHEIAEAIRRAARGQGSLPAEIVSDLGGDLSRESAARAEIQDVLTRSESRFRFLVESAPGAVTITAADGRIVLVNEQTERLFGYERGELIGQSIFMLIPPRLHDEYGQVRSRLFADLAEGRFRERFQFVGLRKDGSEFPSDISLAAMKTDDGILASAFIGDMTGYTPSTSEERFEPVLELAPVAVLIVDEQGLIRLVNKHMEDLFEYDRADLLGKPIEVLLSERIGHRHPSLREGFNVDASDRRLGKDLDLTGRRRDGTEFAVTVSLAPIETDGGRRLVAYLTGATARETRVARVRGISERRDALARIVAAGEEERRRLASDIHDDSIQVMTAAGMRLEILRRSLDDPEQLSRLDELDESIQLAISRLRHLIFELRPPTLDNQGLALALRAYLNLTDETTDTIYALEDQLTSEPSAAKRVVLYRITQEILTNVRKHAGARHATVTLASRDGGTCVTVSDDGTGFVPDLDSEHHGHLGLAAARERAELAGGWLHVTSAPDHGTTVEYWIGEETARTVAAGVAE